MMDENYFWSLFASASLERGLSPKSCANIADEMLVEYKKRFKKPWTHVDVIDPFSATVSVGEDR